MHNLTVILNIKSNYQFLDRFFNSLCLNGDNTKKVEIIIRSDYQEIIPLISNYPCKPKVIVFPSQVTLSEIILDLESKYFMVLNEQDWLDIDGFDAFVEMLDNEGSDVIIPNYMKEYPLISDYEIAYSKDCYPINEVFYKDSIDVNHCIDPYYSSNLLVMKPSILNPDFQINLEKLVNLELFCYAIILNSSFRFYTKVIGHKKIDINHDFYFYQFEIKKHEEYLKLMKLFIDVFHQYESGDVNKLSLSKIYLFSDIVYGYYCKEQIGDTYSVSSIRRLDKYMKEQLPSLYHEMNYGLRYVLWNRKTRFLFSQFNNNAFSKIVEKKTKLESEGA